MGVSSFVHAGVVVDDLAAVVDELNDEPLRSADITQSSRAASFRVDRRGRGGGARLSANAASPGLFGSTEGGR